MSNSTQFKAGDRAIVLPNCVFLYPVPFSIIKIDSFIEPFYISDGWHFEANELAPLPIPYHELDQE